MVVQNNISVVQKIPLSKAVFSVLLFLYFIFAPGELLHVVVGIYKPKIGHLIAIVLLGWIALGRRTVWKIDRRLTLAFVFILVSLFISALFGGSPKRSMGYIGIYLFNFVCYFFLPLQIVQSMNLPHVLRLYWSSFAFVGLYAVLQVGLSIFGIYVPFAMQRIGTLARGQSWSYEPSYYALYMIPYVMFHNGLALFQDKMSHPFKNRFKLFCRNLLLIISTSTGLIVSYPVFFFAFIVKVINPLSYFVTKQKIFKIVLVFLGSLAAFTVLFFEIALNSVYKFFYYGFTTHHSFWARWHGIVDALETFFKSPLIGQGLGGVSSHRFLEESAYDVKMETLAEFESYDPTNCFTEVLASLGIVGLLAFVYLGWVFYRSFQEVMKDSAVDLESKKKAAALFISLVVMIVALQMNQGLFRPYVWIHAAVGYGYFQRVRPT